MDVRPKVEYEDVGKVGGSINLPVKNGTKKWSPEKQKKVQHVSAQKQTLRKFSDATWLKFEAISMLAHLHPLPDPR